MLGTLVLNCKSVNHNLSLFIKLLDLTGVSPLAKHEKACAENQHAFIPFAFDTFGSLAPDAATFLKRVQQVVHSNSSTPKNANFVFSRIGFAIQKGVAVQLVFSLTCLSIVIGSILK
ncbi:hypothetical protein R6Q59_004239 [Mikania micrantha]